MLLRWHVESRARVNASGRVAIRVSFRKAGGIEWGDQLLMRLEDDELPISTFKARLKRAQDLVAQYIEPGTLLSEELIAERREAARNGE
jgi:bifunctional DNA-binding transcriptional regulator/antitoxin component of YhaV-PrlF toxin-antitoxin module